MLESLKNVPLPIESFPVMAQKPLQPEAPKPLKMMAAKGALPVPPDSLLAVWYNLSFEIDDEIRAAVIDTVRTFDDDLMIEQAQKDLPECILDWLSKTTDNQTVLEKIALNPKTHDATLMDMAAVASREIVEIIANNHVRILKAPEIIEKIYNNPSARMAIIDKLLALAKEHNIELSGLKSVQNAMAAADVKDDAPGLSDEEFEAVMKEATAKATIEKKETGVENLRECKSIEEAEANETQEQKTKRISRTQLIDKMNAPQRIRLAQCGSREDRNILMRDSRRVVYMAVIQSPKMSIGEVGNYAASKNMPDEVISYIAGRRDWVRYYPIVVSLVNNPKCPLQESVAFLRQLRVNDLKQLAKSKSVPAQLSRQALMMTREKDQKK